jgi:glucokinase
VIVSGTASDEQASTPALEIGGTHATSALVDLTAGRVLPGSVHRQPLAADGSAEELLGGLLDCARLLQLPAPAHWGVAVPGPFDYRRGVALFEDVGKFDSLRGVDVGAALRRGLPQTIATTSFLNDADAFGLGEFMAGAAAGHGRAAAITLGSGVGSCFLADGAVVDTGPTVPPEGEAHLLTWEGRPLEDTVSRRGIRARYAARTGASVEDGPDVQEIAAHARAGDAAASEVFEYTLGALGRVLAPWIVRFGASVLVVGGSMSASWDVVEPPLRRGLLAGEPVPADISVVPAAQPDEAGLIGAAWHAHRSRASPKTTSS